jgi:type II secretory pathway component GspD/PulD (secretin)
MKLRKKALVVGTAVIICASSAFAQETREIRVTEDRDQAYFTSKVYDLKNTLATDITPFVIGAVQRYDKSSSVERMNDKANKKQLLTVNMPVAMVPYIDDMIAKIDRPGTKDMQNSVIQSTGITKFVYYPEHRASADFLPIGPTVGSSDGSYFFDPQNNMFYWKDVRSKGEGALKYYQAFDRPVPQVELTLNVYEINENDVKELGIDYVSWKNGPGANIFNAGWDFLNMKSFTNVSNFTNMTNLAGYASHGWGGFMVAPNIDMTFIRFLAQKGKAKIATSGALTLVNDYSNDPGPNNYSKAKYRLRFTPDYQNIQKDDKQNASVKQTKSDFFFYLRRPTINFTGETGDKAAMIEFGYEMNILDTVEQTSKGQPIQNVNNFKSWVTVATDTEKLLGTYDREQEVSQYNGMPFLGDIPVLKYLFGAVENSKSLTKVFVTVSAKPITPTENLSEWSGKAVTIGEMLAAKKNEDKK